MKRNQTRLCALVLVSPFAASVAMASDVTVPFTFTANTPAVAAQVNANFSAFETAVDDNAADIASLQATINAMQVTLATQQSALSNLQTTVNNQQATITTLQSGLTLVQANSVLSLDGRLALTVDANGFETARFTAVNVQIVNGLNDTMTTNGLGNLTVGYNESLDGQIPFCSQPAFSDQATCAANGGTWAVGQRTGSHNLVVGIANSYTNSGGLVAGAYNVVNGLLSTVSGGISNLASGSLASVSGGDRNLASGPTSSVSGGYNNKATGNRASVSGGEFNIAGGENGSVSGGSFNSASGKSSSVSGGNNRFALGERDWAAGALSQDQ